MIDSNKEMIILGWCDNGTVDAKFSEGLVYTILTSEQVGVKINDAIRVHGNQISRQRELLFRQWEKDPRSPDWLLWVDSDIVINKDVLKILVDSANKDTHKVVSGVYFITPHPESPLMKPMPAVFDDISKFEMRFKTELPENQLIKIDCAGLGFTIMHKSIIPILRSKFPDQALFAETSTSGDDFVGEDISFFRKLKECGVDVYAHTGITVPHIKRFSFDVNYYNFYWGNKENTPLN